MDDFDDPADLDGDGEFDGIDIAFLEDEEQGNKSSGGGSSGCCVVLLAIGGSVSAGWWCVSNYMI